MLLIWVNYPFTKSLLARGMNDLFISSLIEKSMFFLTENEDNTSAKTLWQIGHDKGFQQTEGPQQGWRPSPITKSTADPKPNVPECRVCDGGAHADQHWTVDPRETLFSDTFIITKSKSSSSLKLKESVRLCEMWLGSCIEEDDERKLTSKNSFVIGWPTTNYVVTLRHITKSKTVEYPSNLTMKVVLIHFGTSAMTTVNVDNKDEVDKVHRIFTQQLRLTGRPTDYRLWVVSGREEAPCPLIVESYQQVDSSDYWD
ncbi:rho GTPase-activating protein 20 isoform X2 [Oncorhynchus masou masou]|uniref:rho GTPase-activating protein 20 isoform X2 n=1 Tax=Oncorhynchus masou masou TaxID=90313 RepID=UPI0031837C5C